MFNVAENVGCSALAGFLQITQIVWDAGGGTLLSQVRYGPLFVIQVVLCAMILSFLTRLIGKGIFHTHTA